jgi:GxxExxY protein
VALGPGLLESVYEEVLAHELRMRGYNVERQKPISIIYKGSQMDMAFPANLIVENKVLVELKSVEELAPVHYKQVLTYLRLADIKLGILVNFNEALIKSGLKRVVNNL